MLVCSFPTFSNMLNAFFVFFFLVFFQPLRDTTKMTGSGSAVPGCEWTARLLALVRGSS